MTSGPILGLDIGGANLKAADNRGHALSISFPLWKNPAGLAAALVELTRPFADCDALAVTMTGELCDCFTTKREGVHAILDAVKTAALGRPIHIWTTHGCFVSMAEANAQPLAAAAANWLALAHLAGRFADTGESLLVDVGSTTTDIVLLHNGRPVPRGLTDPERLAVGELVYTGVRRTPLCALLSDGHAAEFFATIDDAYLLLGLVPERPADRDTADGRPATGACAKARLARMLCGDLETITPEQMLRVAREAVTRQEEMLTSAMRRVVASALGTLEAVVVSGSGEFLARRIAERESHDSRIVSLGDRLGPNVSAAACAYAVAVLAEAPLSEAPRSP